MECWICRRTKEQLANSGIESEFEEFEIEGKDFSVCAMCSTLISLISEEDIDEEAMEDISADEDTGEKTTS